jgi:hypothetical protein
MLQLSLNEIFSETQKALRSVNIEWGIAKDCATLSRWLAIHDQYFLGSILKTIEMYKNQKFSLSLEKNNRKKPLPATLMGTLLVEYISVKKEWKGYIHNPKFLVAAMGLIAEEQQVNLELSDKRNKVIAITNNKKLFANYNKLTTSTGYFVLRINNIPDISKLNEILISKKLKLSNVNNKCWAKLKEMAFETYVPESETSISGAGY